MNDTKTEIVDEAQLEFANDGLDEAVGEKPGDPFQRRLGSLQCTRTEIAKRIDKTETKVVRPRCGLLL